MVTAGPNSPGTAVDDASAGTNAWSNPGNCLSSNNVYASSALNDTHYLLATNFGFAIPAGMVIDGVLVEVEEKWTSNGSGTAHKCRLSAGGFIGTEKNRSIGQNGSESYFSFPASGAPTDPWGATLTTAIINGTDFGAGFRFTGTAPVTVDVDHIRITVYYSALLLGEPDESTPIVMSQTREARVRSRQATRVAQLGAMVAELLPFSTLAVSPELQWALGGAVLVSPELQWALGGRVSQERTLQWRVAPSALRVHYALTGRTGPVVYAFRFEKRSKTNQFIADVSPAVLGAQVDLNNDRTVLRTARFSIDAGALDDRGVAVSIDPLADHIAVIMELLVDGSYELDIPMGLFALNVPAKAYRPQADETWEVEANDLTMHLLEATTTTAYRVASGANYITGTNAVKAIFDSFGLAHAFPATTRTLPVDMTWPPGTPWATVVNDLLHGAGMYSHWFDASGVGRSQLLDDLSRRAADVEYSGDDFVLIPIREEAETTRLANQVIVVVDDPNRAPLSSVATNDDPDSPVSTVTLGRTITKVIQADAAADQATLDERAQRELQESASLYRRATLLTSIDPRREGREVYELTVEGVYEAEKWWVRNWAVELKPAAQMRHTLGRVERVSTS
jgi:hypothetical protein